MRVGKNTMRVAEISDPVWLGKQANRFSRELLKKEHSGPGDTIAAAAARIAHSKTGRKHGLEPSILMQGWNRPPGEWKLSRWMKLFWVHWEEIGSKAEAAYEEKRNEADGTHPALLRLADIVAGRVVAGTKETNPLD